MEPEIANRPKNPKIGRVRYPNQRYSEKRRNMVESAMIEAPRLTCFLGPFVEYDVRGDQ